MKASQRFSLIFACILIVCGAFTSLFALAAVGFDLSRLVTDAPTEQVYTVTESFSSIRVSESADDVLFVPSEDGVCRVICTEFEKLRHTVTVVDGTLCVEKTDTRRWYEQIGIYWHETKTVVALPQQAYTSLSVKISSGDLFLSKELSFAEVSIDSSSGDVYVSCAEIGSLSIKTSSGDISLDSMTAGNLSLETSSGDISLSLVNATSTAVKTASGEVSFVRLICAEHLGIESSSGDVELEFCDAASLSITTSSGDVDCLLLSPKQVVSKTASGEERFPPSTTGGPCTVTTSSGDIEISYKAE